MSIYACISVYMCIYIHKYIYVYLYIYACVEKKSHRSVYRIHLIRFYQHCLSKHTQENERVGGRRIMEITRTDTKTNEHTSVLMHMIRENICYKKRGETEYCCHLNAHIRMECTCFPWKCI